MKIWVYIEKYTVIGRWDSDTVFYELKHFWPFKPSEGELKNISVSSHESANLITTGYSLYDDTYLIELDSEHIGRYDWDDIVLKYKNKT